jgi:hypothetical protein
LTEAGFASLLVGPLLAASALAAVAAAALATAALAAEMRPDSRLARRSSSSTLGGPTSLAGASSPALRRSGPLPESALGVPGAAFAAAWSTLSAWSALAA